VLSPIGFEVTGALRSASRLNLLGQQHTYVTRVRVLGLTRFDGHPTSGAKAPERMPIMETVGRRKPRPRRSFTPEFKADIVEQCRKGDRSIAKVAKDFDLTETAVRQWVNQADVDEGHRPGLTSAEHDELTQLRRENRRLREDVDILRRATAFFAKETR
jgi:transposase